MKGLHWTLRYKVDDYDAKEFVAVLTEDEACTFWIGRLTSGEKNRKGIVTSLRFHWYQASEDIYLGKYIEDFISGDHVRSQQWFGILSTDTVVVSLP